MNGGLSVSLRLYGKKCAVVGGGHIASRRTSSLLRAGARVRLIAPEAANSLKELADDGKIEWIRERFSPGYIEGMFIVVCATDDEAVNRAAALAAKDGGSLVNMAAPPTELGDFTIPASDSVGDITFTVSTNGKSPELARAIARDIGDRVARSYAPWLKRLIPIREELMSRFPTSASREMFWRDVMDDGMMSFVRTRHFDMAEARLRDAADRFGAESQDRPC